VTDPEMVAEILEFVKLGTSFLVQNFDAVSMELRPNFYHLQFGRYWRMKTETNRETAYSPLDPSILYPNPKGFLFVLISD
jgi:hypothetical protein